MWNDIFALPILALAGQAAPAAAAECTAATARAATITEIVETFAKDGWSRRGGECVTVTGIAWRERLYPDVAAIYGGAGFQFAPDSKWLIGYRAPQSPRAGDDATPIGYRSPPAPDADPASGEQDLQAERLEGFWDRPRRVTVTGILGRCNPAILASGNFDSACPGALPLAIRDIEAKILPDPVTRLTAADASPDLVSLSPLATDSVWTPRFAAAADALEVALRSGDAVQWVPLLGSQWLSGGDRAKVAAVLAEPQGAFRRALDSDRPTRRVIFGWRSATPASAADRAASEASRQAEAIVCWSSHPEAERLWPIAAIDADNRPERPYACARIAYSLYDPSPRWRAFIEQHDRGLPEPVR